MNKKINVFVLEDEEYLIEYYKNILDLLGYKVCGYSKTGEEALQMIPVCKPDIILSDIMLKGVLNGIQTIQILQSDSNIPVIFITAFIDDELLQSAKKLKSYSYLTKPVSVDNLKSALEMSIYHHQLDTKIQLELEEHLNLQKLLSQISAQFSDTVDFDESIKKSLKLIGDYTNSSRTSIFMMNSDKQSMNNIYEYCAAGIESAQPKLQNLMCVNFLWWMNMLLNDKLIDISSIEDLPGEAALEKKLFIELNVKSCLAFPIKEGAELTGFISLSQINAKTVWNSASVKILKTISEIISSALSVEKFQIEKKKAQEELQNKQIQMIQNTKMAALGTLVAGVAHEINNPNSLISLNCPLLEEYWKFLKPLLLENKSNRNLKIGSMTLEDVANDIDRIINTFQTGCERIQKIVDNLKEFSRENVEDSKDFYLITDLIDKAYLICGGGVRRRIAKINFNIEKNLPPLYCNAVKIEQVFINLLNNAAEAVDDVVNGTLDFSCRLTATNCIEIKIKDNGGGIPLEKQTNIFEPFYTTKLDKGGTGLGLSIVWGIIKDHNGEIMINPKYTDGAEFIIKLPVVK